MTTEPTTEIVVRRSVSVPLDPGRAFALFTGRMTDFWPHENSIGSTDIAEVVLEPRVGGRWFERGVDGSECVWGHVAEWEPPDRLVLVWQVGAGWSFDPDLHTEVEVGFVEEAPGRTRVELQHRHLERYGDHAESIRATFESPGGWGGILARFADLTT